MELVYYIRIFRKWFWLILTATLIGAGISFVLTTGQVARYSAQTTISVGQYFQDPNPTSSQIYVGQNLVLTYQELVQTHDVLQGVVDALNINIPADAIRGLISTSVIPNTSLLTIRVTFTDPVLAADIANELANQLIVHSPTNLTTDQQDQVEFARTQIQTLSDQVTEQQTLKGQLDQQISASQDSQEIQRLRSQESTVVNQINQAMSAIAQFQTTISTLQQRTNAIAVVDKAIIPTGPISVSSRSSTVLGAAIGALLAMGVVLLIDNFDDKIRTTEAATQLLSLPVLGAIPSFGRKKAGYSTRLLTNFPSMSPMMEAYRRLRTNTIFAMDNSNEKIIVVTSCGPGEGKSVTSANLAATMANSGMRVLLIDADMRRPVIHEIFGLENNIGLTTLLLVDPKSNGNIDIQDDDGQGLRKLEQCLQPTQIPNLKVITSGFIPENPAEVLGSPLMNRWIEAFRASTNVDIVIFDTPPVLMFADGMILSNQADAAVLLVIDSGNTRRSAAAKAYDQLKQLQIPVKGLVLNHINMREESGYYGDYYYKSYYYSSKNGDRRGGILSSLFRRRKAVD